MNKENIDNIIFKKKLQNFTIIINILKNRGIKVLTAQK